MLNIQNDQPTGEDFLDRVTFAQHIAKVLASSINVTGESTVVGICGKWGSGKTTFIKLLEKEIIGHYESDGGDHKIIHFNSWSESSKDDLNRDLLQRILKELDGVNWKDAAEKGNEVIKKYLKLLDYVKFLKHTHPIVGNIFDAIEEHGKKVSILSIAELKKEIDGLLAKKNLKLYVFIDDLDRLESSELADIFKCIKMNVNFTNTTFIVAYDKDIITSLLNERFANKAEEYLEKIIQVDFLIPEILEEKIEEIFFRNLKIILGGYNIYYSEAEVYQVWRHRGLREYFFNLRDIKRYFNSLTLSISSIGDNVNVTDYIALEAIKVFDHRAYTLLHVRILTEMRSQRWTNHTLRTSDMSELGSGPTKALIEFLFMENASLHILDEGLNEKRLRNSAFFERYFTLGISKKDVTQADFNDFLQKGTNKMSILQNILGNGRIVNLFRRLGDRDLGKFQFIDDKAVFESILQFWDSQSALLNHEMCTYIWNAYFNLIHCFQDKFSTAKHAFQKLLLSETTYEPAKFFFNHTLIGLRDEGRSDSMLVDIIKEQEEVFTLEAVYITKLHMGKMYNVYFQKLRNDESVYISTLFLRTLAKYQNELYFSNLVQYLDSPIFLFNMLKYNFTLWNEGQKDVFLYEQYKDLLLPDSYFDLFLKKLKNLKKADLKLEETIFVESFLRNSQP